MADVSIDSAINNATARGMRAVVFVSADVGYWFYAEDTTAEFSYRKTTDGGATWGSPVVISTGSLQEFDVWYDQWTPGDTGSLIHMFWATSAADDAMWRSLDTSNDTFGTARVVFAGATFLTGRGVFISGTKTLDGTLYCAYDGDAGAEKGFHRSTDGGTTWSASLDANFIEATIDQCLLFPAANTGDGRDCLALYHDASTDELTLKLWDSSGAAASESSVILTLIENTTDFTGQYGFSASIRHSDGKLICAAVSERDTATADHRVFELNCTAPSTFAITEKTAITTNIDDHYYPSVFIDQLTDDIYVAFNGLRTGGETLGTTTKVYYTKSSDGGTTWTSGSTAYMEGATAAVFQVWAPLMGPRFYVGWRVGTTLVGNKVNSLTFSSGATHETLATGATFSVGSARGTVLRAIQATATSWSSASAAPTLLRPAAATGASWSLASTIGGGIRGLQASGVSWSLGSVPLGAIRDAQAAGASWSIAATRLGLLRNAAASGLSWSLAASLVNTYKGLSAAGATWSLASTGAAALRAARATGASWSIGTTASGAIRAARATGVSWSVADARLVRLVAMSGTGASWSLAPARANAMRGLRATSATWTVADARAGVNRAAQASGATWSISIGVGGLVSTAVFAATGTTWTAGKAYLDVMLRAIGRSIHVDPSSSRQHTLLPASAIVTSPNEAAITGAPNPTTYVVPARDTED